MCFCTILTRCMPANSIVAIIILWKVHDLLVSVVKLEGKGRVYITGTHFLRIKMGLHPGAFCQGKRGMELVNASLPQPLYIICILQSPSDRAIILL